VTLTELRPHLTRRENWWVDNVLQGVTSRQMAEEEGISVRTVEVYGRRFANKAGLPVGGRQTGTFREAVLRMALEG
jgi:FixJ family two-component response regulator